MTIVSIGEILWDVIDAEEHLGGAPFNLAAHAARLGHRSIFISAVGADRRGRLALERAEALGVDRRPIRVVEGKPTGTVSVRLVDGQPDYVIHRPAAYDEPALDEADWRYLRAAAPDWIAHGTLAQQSSRVLELTRRVIAEFPAAKRFYDVNLRKDSYSRDLLAALLPEATVLKINEHEAAALGEMFGDPPESLEEFCRRWSRRHSIEIVCVTRGAAGSGVFRGGEYFEVPAPRVEVRDAVGAGDAFSAAFLHGLNAGRPIREVAEFANRVGALVASRSGAVPEWSEPEAWAPVR